MLNTRNQNDAPEDLQRPESEISDSSFILLKSDFDMTY